MEFQMRNKTFISSMVLSVACVSAANATVVYDTIDPFTTPESASNTSGQVYSVLTGTLWNQRSIQTTTSSASRATTSMTIGSGSMLFGVTQKNAASTSATQRAYLNYSTITGTEQYPDFTNFTSLDFNYVSDLTGDLQCRIFFADAVTPITGWQTISVGSGLMSFDIDDFGGGINPLSIAAVSNLSIEFQRSGSNASGSLTITNLVANGASSIPAPGALALLGAGGLVGARRRRD
jgi:MYXO-CTERM domain-containing protein